MGIIVFIVFFFNQSFGILFTFSSVYAARIRDKLSAKEGWQIRSTFFISKILKYFGPLPSIDNRLSFNQLKLTEPEKKKQLILLFWALNGKTVTINISI